MLFSYWIVVKQKKGYKFAMRKWQACLGDIIFRSRWQERKKCNMLLVMWDFNAGSCLIVVFPLIKVLISVICGSLLSNKLLVVRTFFFPCMGISLPIRILIIMIFLQEKKVDFDKSVLFFWKKKWTGSDIFLGLGYFFPG